MYEDMKQAIEDGAPGVSEVQLETMRQLVETAENELAKLPANAGTIGYDTSISYVEGVKKNKGAVATAAQDVANAGSSTLSSESKKLSTVGADFIQNFIYGINSKKTDAQNIGVTLGSSAKTGINQVSLYDSGQNSGQGFIDGIIAKIPSAETASNKLAKAALSALNKRLDIHSPSKETELSGKFFDEGFAGGVDNNAKKVEQSVKSMSDLALQTLDNTDMEKDITARFKLYDDVPTSMATMINNSGAQGTSSRSYGDMNINLNIGEFVNNRAQDVKELAAEIMFYAHEMKEEEDRVYA